MTSKYGEVICKAKLLIIIAHLLAKAALLNCNQFNNQYGVLHVCTQDYR